MNTLKSMLLSLPQGGWLTKKQVGSTENHFPLALLGLAQICSWGTLYYSFPQLAQAMLAEFNWAKSDVYAALSICLIFSSFAAIPIGKLIDKGLGCKVMAAGSVIAGFLLVAGSQINSLLFLYIIFAGIGIVQAATLYEAAFSVINNNHQHSDAKSKIVTLTLWGGFASTIFIPLIELMLSNFSWQMTFILLGVINIFVCSAIYLLLLNGQMQRQKNNGNTHSSNKGHNVFWAIKQPIFWALLICFSLFATGASTFKFHLYPIWVERDFSAEEVVFILAVMGPAQVLGRVILKIAGDKISALQLGILTTSALPVTFISLVYIPDNIWFFVPLIVLFGAASGMMTIVKGTAIPELLTKEAYGAINGAMSIPIKFIKAGAPALAAIVWMMTLSYDAVLILLGFVSLLAVLCFAIVKQLARYTH